MTEFIKQKFPDSKILEFVDDGINQTCYFRSEDESSDKSKYVGKRFTANLIDTNDYLAVSKVTKEYVENREHLKIPSITDFGIFEDDAYLIYEYVEGDQLNFTDVYENGELEYYIEFVGEMLAELHNQGSPVDNFGWFTIDNGTIGLKNGYTDSLGLSLSQINYSFENISESILSSSIRDKIREIFQDNIDFNLDPSVCHCDVKYDNLIHNDNSTHIIDWEFIRSADPLYDLVKTERQLIGRFSQDDKIDEGEYNYYKQILHSSYFETSNNRFNKDKYRCYWIREMIECLSSCENWYGEDVISDVESYYVNNIEYFMNQLQS
jgi:tRNA A-37 threonylcarbamoyl transferase component Bud32